VRSGSTWTQQGPKLVGDFEPYGQWHLGRSVALSADGNTALIGASRFSGTTGAACVFTRSGTTWTQQGPKLIGTGTSGTAGALQGMSVALSADGNTALVGGPFDNDWVGSAWVFTRSGTTWTQQGEKLTAADASGQARLGSAVALSADGNTAAIGGNMDDSKSGAAWIFTRSGSTWTQQGSKLVGTGAELQAFQGTSVSLSGSGDVLLVGAPGDGPLCCYYTWQTGATWVFRRIAGAWRQQGTKLVGSGAVRSAGQGNSVFISSDGMTAIVGGPSDGFYNIGAAWIFTRTNDLRRAGDHDGDIRSDLTVYHTDSGLWSSLTSASGFTNATNRSWGGPRYTPVPGDYDGDGQTDPGLYEPSSGYWYALLSSANFDVMLSMSAGGPDWTPVPRDYDGDGKTDFVVYNSTSGQWYGLTSSTDYTPSLNVNWGGTGYAPVAADYDGDGKADPGVYNMTTGLWSVLLSSSNYTTSLGADCGGTGWTPVPADYDGDGRDDMVVYNADAGQWYGLASSANFTPAINVMWGGSDYQPVKGDYDGDGKADFAVYVSSTGMWYILLSGANYTTSMVRALGGPGYAAIPQFP
jgi:hypothetical protein